MKRSTMPKSVRDRLDKLEEFENRNYPQKVLDCVNRLANLPPVGAKRVVQLGQILSIYGLEMCPKVDSELFEIYTVMIFYLENDEELVRLAGKVILERMKVYQTAMQKVLDNRNNN